MVHTIYNANEFLSDEDLKEAWKDEAFGTEYENFEDIPESVKCDFMELNDRDNFDAEITNLSSIEIPSLRKVLVLADLGLWNGRRSAYKIATCDTYADVLRLASYEPNYYVEDNEFKCDDSHHDGTNHLIFRLIHSELAEKVEYEVPDNNEFLLKHTTPMAEPIRKLYGWS